MKKIAKLSLVAAVAVAGLTTANAKPLEEAIKNVDVSGQFRYRLQQRDSDTAAADLGTNTDVEIEIGAKVAVTDNIKAVFKIDNAPNNAQGTSTTDMVDVEDYYFSYSKDNLTVNFGQQNIPSRQVDGKQGDGIVVLNKMGAMTVGGAYFFNSNATGANDIASVLATGKVGPATVLAQYVNANDVATAYNLMASANVGPVKVAVETTGKDLEGDNGTYGTTKLFVSGKAGKVAASLGYVMTGENGSGSLDPTAVEQPSELIGFLLYSATQSDLSVVVAKATVPVMPKTSFTAYYAGGETGANGDSISEMFGQVSYKVAKNLATYARLGTLTGDAVANDVTRARLEIKYSF